GGRKAAVKSASPPAQQHAPSAMPSAFPPRNNCWGLLKQHVSIKFRKKTPTTNLCSAFPPNADVFFQSLNITSPPPPHHNTRPTTCPSSLPATSPESCWNPFC